MTSLGLYFTALVPVLTVSSPELCFLSSYILQSLLLFLFFLGILIDFMCLHKTWLCPWWMCCVLIRIQLLFIVCTHTGFDHVEEHLPGICCPPAENDCTLFQKLLYACLLSIFSPLLCFTSTPPHSCFPYFTPVIFQALFSHYQLLQSLLKIVEFYPQEEFPVCLSCHWYHQVCTHILPSCLNFAWLTQN